MLCFLYSHWEFFAGLLAALLGFNLYSYYSREKDLIKNDIIKIIENCRKLSSFDEKSEDKMSSWLELGKGELHRKSLFTLRRIKKEMIRYYQIHINMDIEKNGW